MPNLFKYENGGSQWPDLHTFSGKTCISGTTVPGFITKRGDVVSGSHVVSSSVRLGQAVNGNTGGCGTWQVAAGVYQDIFPQQWPANADKFIDHKLVVPSGSLASFAQWANYSIREVGTFVTSSSPMKSVANNAPVTVVQWEIVSGSNPVPVDPPFDFQVYTFMVFDNTNGNF
jgi:hypothetical protein